MTSHPMMWVDAFTEERFGGNPCGVIFEADDIDEQTRIAFTRETGLVECAFLQQSEKAAFGVRYYTASGEIPMAGHPTIATMTALIAAESLALASDPVETTLEVGAGVLPITVTPRPGRAPLIAMRQLRPRFLRQYDPGPIAALYGLSSMDVVGAPQTVSTGSPFCIVALSDHDALRRAELHLDRFEEFKRSRNPDFFEPYLCVARGATEAGDTFARLLLTPPEPPEDPFTGSATGCMAAYLWANGLIESPRFIAEQGHWMGRPGRAEVEVLGPHDDIEGVMVAGSGVLVMQGEALGL